MSDVNEPNFFCKITNNDNNNNNNNNSNNNNNNNAFEVLHHIKHCSKVCLYLSSADVPHFN